MPIAELHNRPEWEAIEKVGSQYAQLAALLDELRSRPLPDAAVDVVNGHINELNHFAASGNAVSRIIREKQTKIISYLAKEHKIVPKHYYRNLWMAAGMAAFGIPLGAAFGASLGNMAFLGLGLPMGLAIGIALGTGMDEKAAKEGRQLAFTVKH